MMPRYFFDVRRPDGTDMDEGGTVLADREAANAFARRIVRELKESGGYDRPGFSLIVRDHTGATIHSIPFIGLGVH